MQECGLSRGKLSMKIPEICPGKMHRHIDWLMQRWFGHCNVRDTCEIRGLISPAKLWWRVFLGFLGLGWLHIDRLPLTNSNTYSWWCYWCHMMPFFSFKAFFHPFSLCFRPLKAYCGPRTSHLARDHYAHSLVTACSRAGAKSVQKQHLHTSHMPFKRWAMPQDAYTFGLKFGLKLLKRLWKKALPGLNPLGVGLGRGWTSSATAWPTKAKQHD